VFQNEQLAQLVREKKVEHLCLVHRGDIYGRNISRGVKKKLEESALQVEITLSEYDPGNADLSKVMSPCSALVCSDSGADGGASCSAPPAEKVGLMLITFIEDGALILDDAKRRGWSASKQAFFFADGAYDRGLVDRVKDPSNIEGALGTAPAGPNPATAEGEIFRRFEAAFVNRYKRNPSIFIENAYDSMYVAAIAIELAKTATPGVAIRDAMQRVSVPGGVKVEAGDWKTILKTIREGKPIDFHGASGTVDFDEKGDVKPPYNYVIWKISGGQLVEERRAVIE
jgi:branched-chain amino acid transport system substrate-binding protein